MIATPMAQIKIAGREVFGKLERDHPTGSHKDRLAQFITSKWQNPRGQERHAWVSSSGNFARAIAHYSKNKHTKLSVVTDVLSPASILESLKEFEHVNLHVVNDPDHSGSHLHARKRLIRDGMQKDSGSIFVDQYDDLSLPNAYARTLGPELLTQTDGRIAAVFVAVGTGATVNGLLRFRDRNGLNFPIFGVDAQGSALLRSPKTSERRLLSGYGNGRLTGIMADCRERLDFCVFVHDIEAVAFCSAMRSGGLWLGASSGAVAAAAQKVLKYRSSLLARPGRIVLLMPDKGEYYDSTVFNAEWLAKNLLSNPLNQGVRYEEPEIFV